MLNHDFAREAYARTRNTRRLAWIAAFCLSIAMLGVGLAMGDWFPFVVGLWSGLPGAFVTASAIARRRRLDSARRLTLVAWLLCLAVALALATSIAIAVTPLAAVPITLIAWLLVYASVCSRIL